MRKFCLFIILVSLFFFVFSGCELWPRDTGTVIHIAIGLSYEGSGVQALGAPPNDAICLSRAFEQLYDDRPFHSIVLKDKNEGNPLTKKRLTDILNDTMKRLTPSDLLIITYSGHGWTDGSWALHPAIVGQPIIGEEGQINESALLGVEELFALLTQSPSPVLLISDSCYSGNFVAGETSSISSNKTHQNLTDAYGRFFTSDRYSKEVFVMTATTGEHSSYEPLFADHAHGYFTSALLEGLGWDCQQQELTTRSNRLSTDELYHYVLEHQLLPTKPSGGLLYQRPMIVGGPLDLVLVNR
jgi:uncharacterized caspase-like protein